MSVSYIAPRKINDSVDFFKTVFGRNLHSSIRCSGINQSHDGPLVSIPHHFGSQCLFAHLHHSQARRHRRRALDSAARMHGRSVPCHALAYSHHRGLRQTTLFVTQGRRRSYSQCRPAFYLIIRLHHPGAIKGREMLRRCRGCVSRRPRLNGFNILSLPEWLRSCPTFGLESSGDANAASRRSCSPIRSLRRARSLWGRDPRRFPPRVKYACTAMRRLPRRLLVHANLQHHLGSSLCLSA
ncbi:hypothetical protein K456DRAFT_1160365 [Colletotrichum gloeosporioides 23]|nr:hypothetical protein K456DRAFT_1160365 [Colletotrichum gloeosporioides 23]